MPVLKIARNSAETAFPQNFLTRKLGTISVFYAVLVSRNWSKIRSKLAAHAARFLTCLNHFMAQVVEGYFSRFVVDYLFK